MKKQKEEIIDTRPEIMVRPESVTKPDPKENSPKAIELKNQPGSVTEISPTTETPEQVRFRMRELFDTVDHFISSRLYNPNLILKTPLENLGVVFDVEEMERINSFVVIYRGLLLDQIQYLEKFHSDEVADKKYKEFLENEHTRISEVALANGNYIKTRYKQQEEAKEDQFYENIYQGKQTMGDNFNQEMELSRITFEKKVLPHLRPAKNNDYSEWLTQYIIYKGSMPTNKCDYPMPEYNWFVAKSDFRMVPLYGSQAINIVVPSHVKYLGGDLGHSSLYFLKDHTNLGGSVPQYSNT